jgi:hypothetical protein
LLEPPSFAGEQLAGVGRIHKTSPYRPSRSCRQDTMQT